MFFTTFRLLLLFLPFYGFYGFCDLEFPLVKSSKTFIAHLILRDTSFKHAKSRVCKGRFFYFHKFMSFTAAKKNEF